MLFRSIASTEWFATISSSPLAGLGAVGAAVILGLIPACGVELAVVGLFVAGGLPLPALVTYLVGQDGSGVIPLAASKPRAALITTLVTTAVAAAIGLLMLAIF